LKPDTPLPEVAAFLPHVAANLLVNQPPEIQMVCCMGVRDSVVFLETAGVILDPIQFEGVITMLVAQQIPVAHEIRELLVQNKELRDRHGST
jgi:hypothetical protein